MLPFPAHLTYSASSPSSHSNIRLSSFTSPPLPSIRPKPSLHPSPHNKPPPLRRSSSSPEALSLIRKHSLSPPTNRRASPYRRRRRRRRVPAFLPFLAAILLLVSSILVLSLFISPRSSSSSSSSSSSLLTSSSSSSSWLFHFNLPAHLPPLKLNAPSFPFRRSSPSFQSPLSPPASFLPSISEIRHKIDFHLILPPDLVDDERADLQELLTVPKMVFDARDGKVIRTEPDRKGAGGGKKSWAGRAGRGAWA